jgi:hypothetical protein
MGEKRIESDLLVLPYLKVIHEYRYLEFQVHRILDRFCIPFCKSCICCCCKKEICEESINSFWLELIWTSFGCKILYYHDNDGWLTERGCKLIVGRPPVCYDFFCNNISNYISIDIDSLVALRKIAHLITFSGKSAIGNKHLVTLTKYEIINKLSYKKLSNRITKSLEMLGYYESVLYKSHKDTLIV